MPREGEVEASNGHKGAWALLAALVLVQGFFLVGRLKEDARPLAWDQSVHMRAAWSYDKALSEGRPSGLLHPPAAPGHPPYPPLTHFLMVPLLRAAPVLGLDVEDGAALVNLGFILLLVVSAFILASDLWGPGAGVCAAALAVCFPPVRQYSRELLVDVPLAAWTLAAYAAWSRSRHFHLRGWSVLLSAALAAGFLTKFTFLLYILPILGDALWTAWRRRRDVASYHAAGAFLLAGFLAAPWYLLNIVPLTAKVSRAAGLGGQEGDPTNGFAAWMFYGDVLQGWTGWTGLVILAGAAGWLALSRPGTLGVLGAWFGSGYAVWSLVSNKDPRYILPAALALPVAAAGLPFRLSWVLAGLVFVGTGLQEAGALKAAARPAWPLAEMLHRAVERRSEPGGPAAVLTLLANHESMNGNNLLWTAEREGLDGKVLVRSRSSGLGEFSEFVLLKTGDLGPARTVVNHERLRVEVLRPEGWFQKNFEEAGAWSLPDGNAARLFHRRPAEGVKPVGLEGAAVVRALFSGVAAEGLSVRCGEDSFLTGVEDCAGEATAFFVKGLPLRGVRFRMERVRATADDEGRPRVLSLKVLRLEQARISGRDLAAHLAGRVKGLKAVSVQFIDGETRVSARWKFLPVRLRATMEYDPGAAVLRARVVSLKVFGVPVPGLGSPRAFSLAPGRGWPAAVALSGLRGVSSSGEEGGYLEVSP